MPIEATASITVLFRSCTLCQAHRTILIDLRSEFSVQNSLTNILDDLRQADIHGFKVLSAAS